MRFPGWFAVAVGLSMVVQWAIFLASGNVPELRSEPVRIAFHLAAEFLTAVLLVIAGLATVRSRGWGRPLLLVAFGMLLYTSVVSPGYFAQSGQIAFVAMFGAILAVTTAAITAALRAPG